ncbi:DUF1302 domain-containing protein [Pseudomonas promysalinigenes]|uniref:DUF1302 domain-containing protein n=1 Tax=Pseudomonas promysalinigenes TaxID=485898 RepID=UPI002719D1E2
MTQYAISSPQRRARMDVSKLALAVAVLSAGSANAMSFDTGIEEFSLRWDNTVKYSTAWRTKDRSAALSSEAPASPNQNDGNNNFDKGLVSNRLDLFSEMDASYKNFGARVSAAAWYDSIYHRSNDNDGTTDNRPAGESANTFPDDTKSLMGGSGEILDAFVYTNFDLAGHGTTARLGRHTIVWGESLFFASNSIAGVMAPVDTIKARSVPSSTTKEILRPVGKASTVVQISDNLSFSAYVPYEWEASRLVPVGSYLSPGDSVGPGAELNLAGAAGNFDVISERTPSAGRQGGVALNWHSEAIDTDVGFYAVRYNALAPSGIYLTWAGVPGLSRPLTFQSVYHEGSKAYGISASRLIGDVSFGAEVSLRDNVPLSSDGVSINAAAVTAGNAYNTTDNPGYAVGRTAHAQISWISSLSPRWFYNEASWSGEIAWNRRLSFTRGEQFANALADRDASAIRMVFRPVYRQVFDGVDLAVPISASYVHGKSSAIGPSWGVDRGGDFSIGVDAVYLNRWNVGLSYVGFYGSEGPPQNAARQQQYKQTLKDRNFINLSVSTTF